MREWVRQAERDAGTGDGGLTLAEAVERAVSRTRARHAEVDRMLAGAALRSRSPRSYVR